MLWWIMPLYEEYKGMQIMLADKGNDKSTFKMFGFKRLYKKSVMRRQDMDNSIEERLIAVMEQNGIFISDDWDAELDFDSITFISTIVGIETEFGIDIPEELLLIDNFKTFNMYINNVKQAVHNHTV